MRALAGDFEGAADDLEVYLSFRPTDAPDAVRRRGWVDALREGRNPLTGFELGSLGF